MPEQYLQGTLIDGLYYNDYLSETGQSEQGLVYYGNRLLGQRAREGYSRCIAGYPRIRMIKVRNDSCSVVESFSREITLCYSAYDTSVEDKETFGLINGSAYMNRS